VENPPRITEDSAIMAGSNTSESIQYYTVGSDSSVMTASQFLANL